MADTIFTTSNALTWKLYSRELFVEAKKRCVVMKFVGRDSSSMIQMLDETQKHPGDQITYGLRMQMTGDGIAGESILDGNEEALVFYSDQLKIDQMRWGVRINGNMTQQRVAYNLREQAKSGLADWISSRFDTVFFNTLCGNTGVTRNPSNLYSGFNSLVAPTSTHQIYAGTATSEATLTSSMVFTLPMLNQAVYLAKTLTPAIRPIKLKGGEYYVAFLHPLQVKALRNSTSSNDWNAIYQSAIQGGAINNNPIFTGAIGMYNGVILHEDARVCYGDNTQNTLGTDLGAAATGTTSVARALFCGAQSGVIGFGRGYDWPHKFKWVEDTKDYENQVGIAIGTVYGMKKSVFNSTDFATIVMSTWAA